MAKNKTIDEAINDLKQVVRELYRTAGSLDKYVEMIETDEDRDSLEWFNMYVSQVQAYRMEYVLKHNVSESEKEAWHNLREAIIQQMEEESQ